MKRVLCAIPGMLLCAVLIAGCGAVKLDADESVVYVDKKGAVTFLDVQAFDQSMYDEEELKSFLEDEIGTYTDQYGRNTVKLGDLTVADGIAKLTLSCQSAEDFARYNGIEMYQGRIVDSLAAGYVFDGEFVKVESGTVVGEATKQEIYQESDLKVVILKSELDVRVEGEICYVSCQNVSLTGADGVSIRSGYYLGEKAAQTSSPAAGASAGIHGGAASGAAGADGSGAAGNSGTGTAGADGSGNSGTGAAGGTADNSGTGSDGSGTAGDSGSGSGGADAGNTTGGESGAQTAEGSTDAGMVIDADTSGESASAPGAYEFDTDEAAETADTYVFIVYR